MVPEAPLEKLEGMLNTYWYYNQLNHEHNTVLYAEDQVL